MRDIKELENWTIDDFAQAHKELWETISKLPDDDLCRDASWVKEQALYMLGIDIELFPIIKQNCFACECKWRIPGYSCTNCMVVWGIEYKKCYDYGSPYNTFRNSGDIDTRRELALKIANLSIRRIDILC